MDRHLLNRLAYKAIVVGWHLPRNSWEFILPFWELLVLPLTGGAMGSSKKDPVKSFQFRN